MKEMKEITTILDSRIDFSGTYFLKSELDFIRDTYVEIIDFSIRSVIMSDKKNFMKNLENGL